METHKSGQYFVIGKPIAHSLSPLIHNQALRELGLEGTYSAREVAVEELADFFAEFRSAHHAGCNITLPLKVAALALVDEASQRAQRLGAINTLYWREGGLWGENTDVIGFRAPLEGKNFAHALILGAGGVSRAAICALQEMPRPDSRCRWCLAGSHLRPAGNAGQKNHHNQQKP